MPFIRACAVYVNECVLNEVKRIVDESEIVRREAQNLSWLLFISEHRLPRCDSTCTALHHSGSWACVADREDDKQWPEPNRDGRQEFEVVLGGQHISFAVSKQFNNNRH